MPKSLSRKRSSVDLKAEVIDPLKALGQAERREAEATLASEFVFANARRQAKAMADGCGSDPGQARLKTVLVSLVAHLEIVETVLRPAADHACAVLGLPNNHALRSDLRSFTRHGMDSGGVVQQILGRFVTSDEPAKVPSLSSTLVSIDVDHEGVVRESTPDALLRRG